MKDFDYAQPGAYFVTICTKNRQSLFGNIVEGEIRLNPYGLVVREEWIRSGEIRHETALDEFIVMPNHLHGVVMITESNVWADDRQNVGATGRSTPPTGPAPKTIGALVAGFKSVVTKRINQIRGTLGAPVWQRNYYEHVIRDEKSLNRIRGYIMANPQRWRSDKENPERDSDDQFHQWLESFKQRPRRPDEVVGVHRDIQRRPCLKTDSNRAT